ncbi:MAG TPA: tetratricopeptide repeat protein, partial [Myxococcales bacterium]|nr:tetratricopeptide repeat protein [Myxococcales bacterium]
MKQLDTLLQALASLSTNSRGGFCIVRCQNQATMRDAYAELTAQEEYTWHTLDVSELDSSAQTIETAIGLISGPNDVCIIHGLPADSGKTSEPEFYRVLETQRNGVATSGGPRLVILLNIPQLRAISRLAPKLFKEKNAYVAWPVQDLGQSDNRAEGDEKNETQTFTGGSQTQVSREEAIKVIRRLKEQTQTMANTSERAQTILKIALIQSSQGMLEEARQTGSQAARIYKELSDMQGLAQCYEVMGSLAERRGNVKFAIEWMRHACEAWRGVGNEVRTAEVGAKLGHLCYVTGNHEDAAKYFQEAISIDEALGNEIKVSAGLRRLGMLALDQDQFPVAENLFRQSKDMCDHLDDRVGM